MLHQLEIIWKYGLQASVTSLVNPGLTAQTFSQSSQSQWWDSAIYPFIVNITLELQIKSTSKTYGWWKQVYNFCWALNSPLNFHKKLFYSTEEKNL